MTTEKTQLATMQALSVICGQLFPSQGFIIQVLPSALVPNMKPKVVSNLKQSDVLAVMEHYVAAKSLGGLVAHNQPIKA